MADPCIYVVDPGSRHVDPEPPETCGRDAVDGTDYCPEHHGMTDLFGPDPDAAYEYARDLRIEQAEEDRRWEP